MGQPGEKPGRVLLVVQFIGVYANISATTFYLDQDDIEETINPFNQPYFSVKYYDFAVEHH